MSEVATVVLSGRGAVGYTTYPFPLGMLATMPKTVKLGRVKPKARPLALKLGDYIGTMRTGAIPTKVDYSEKAQDSIRRMYVNDELGCCVIAGKYHNIGVWSGNDSDSGGIVTVDDATIRSVYNKLKAGPGDSGCVITDVLDYFVHTGLPTANAVQKIDGYVSCDWRNEDLSRAGIYLFGAGTIGIDLPEEWTNSDVWDVTNSRIVGGHDVSPVGFNEKGVLVASWGRIYLMTWAAFTSSRWVSEFYIPLAPLWYGNDKLAANGFSVEQLKSDMKDIGGGHLPPIEPTPPAPPGPVDPPAPPIPVPPAPPVLFAEGPVTVTGCVGLRLVTMTGTVKLPVKQYDQYRGAILDRIKWLDVLADIKQLVADLKPIGEKVQELVELLNAPYEDVLVMLRHLGILPDSYMLVR